MAHRTRPAVFSTRKRCTSSCTCWSIRAGRSITCIVRNVGRTRVSGELNGAPASSDLFMLNPKSLGEVQRAIAEADLDGWLLFDFHGLNPVAIGLLGLEGMGTRR